MPAVIKPCSCKSPYQDEKYGKGYRVHNIGTGKDAKPIYRCTVCGKERGN